MGNAVWNKLKSNSGESIAETLVAVLIAAFALLMLAGTINSATNLITKSQNSLKAYYQLNNKIEKRETGSADNYSVENGTATFSEYETDKLTIKDTPVVMYKNTKIGGKPVVAYDEKKTESAGGE